MAIRGQIKKIGVDCDSMTIQKLRLEKILSGITKDVLCVADRIKNFIQNGVFDKEGNLYA